MKPPAEFIWMSGRLTPPTAASLLVGIMHDTVLKLAREDGIATRANGSGAATRRLMARSHGLFDGSWRQHSEWLEPVATRATTEARHVVAAE